MDILSAINYFLDHRPVAAPQKGRNHKTMKGKNYSTTQNQGESTRSQNWINRVWTQNDRDWTWNNRDLLWERSDLSRTRQFWLRARP